MPDRRAWPSAKPPEAALSIVAQRAMMLKNVGSSDLRAFLAGLAAAHTAAVDLAEELYNVGDAASGTDRTEAFARAAGAKLASQRIGHLFDAAAAQAGEKPSRRGLRALLARLIGAAEPAR